MNDSTFQQSFSGAQFNPVLSDNDSNETEKHNNKRSCDNCRNRKVRCDAHLSIPCSSCRRFDAECIISKPKKSGVPSRKYMDSLEKRIEHLEALLLEQSISNAPTGSSSSSPIAATKQQEDTIESPLPDISKVSDPNTRSPSPPTHTQQKPNKFIFSPWMNVTENSCSEQHTSISADKSLTSSLPEPHSQSTIDMIQEIPKFTPEFAECLLGRYFNFLHPRIPMLDKRSFLIQYYYQHPQPLEKHLFYAVCAVGCQFLPRTEMTGDCLIEREIGRCLREKAMTVMNLAYKESTISTLQTLLLMALLAPNSRNGEGSSTNWLILGASQDLELHREDRYQHQSRSEVELRRRLAYSIYMWDKFSAMATGKPFAIRDEDFNVQMPSIYEQQPDDNIAINDLLSDGCIIPMLLEQTEIDICEKRPVYRPQTQIIPMSRLVSRILTSLYIPKNIYEAGVVDVNMILNIDMSLYAWRKAGLEQPAKDYIFHNGMVLVSIG
ncbi:fungal-specific transcription factor domain-containing protein [Phascolomyces articulosus]|uniref:Fungal-specific transcription factor domain-containing protein n=1 Tax=Phascolomyces articulosus TaxID=60185 RepID=A0AAD5K4W6_9FUNG|nr:fungal-specific transcription factor domain-containing protein [Phascolomyces articulosus]